MNYHTTLVCGNFYLNKAISKSLHCSNCLVSPSCPWDILFKIFAFITGYKTIWGWIQISGPETSDIFLPRSVIQLVSNLILFDHGQECWLGTVILAPNLCFFVFFFLPTPKYEFQQVNKVKFSPLALNVSWCIQGMTCHLLSIILYRIDFSISHFEFQPHLLGNNCLNTSSPNTFLMGFPWQR